MKIQKLKDVPDLTKKDKGKESLHLSRCQTASEHYVGLAFNLIDD